MVTLWIMPPFLLVHIQNLIQASCSLLTVLQLICSASCSLLFLVTFRPGPFIQFRFFGLFFSITFVLPPVAFCHSYSPAVHFLCTCHTQVDIWRVTQQYHYKLVINNHSGLWVVLSSSVTVLCSSCSAIWSNFHSFEQNKTLSFWSLPLNHPSFPNHNQIFMIYLLKVFPISVLFSISN